MAFQNPNASVVSVVFSLTLTVPFPLLLTVPLGMFSQFSFPSFLVCSLLSSLRFLPFSFLFSLFLPFSPLFACWRWEVFIGQKGAGASLLPPYGSTWGAGLAALPQRLVGWAVGVAGRARLPWCIIMRVCGVSEGGRHVACRVHWRKKKKLPSPAARLGERERGTMSFWTTLFFLLKKTWNGAVSFKGGTNICFPNQSLIYPLFF